MNKSSKERHTNLQVILRSLRSAPGLILWFRLLIAYAALLLLVSCAARNHDEKYYLIAAQIRLPYWQTAGAGFLKGARQLGLQAEFVGPETYDPVAQQLEFERVAKTKPSGILISVANPDLMKADIDAAIAAGIPVITMDADSPNSKRLFFIGTDNYQAGVMGAKVAAKELGGKGNVVIFTIPAMANLNERLRGYRDTFAAYPGMKIMSIVDIAGNPHIAFDVTQRIITKQKDNVAAFVCLEAAAGKEVAEALNERKVKGKTVVAMDTESGTLEWIKKGVIAATIAQKPYTMSYIGLTMLRNLHDHPPAALQQNWADNPDAEVPVFVDTGATLIDRNSVDALIETQKSAIESHR
jgi:ribose transport system substrate-binding protein